MHVDEYFGAYLGMQCDCGDRTTKPHAMTEPMKVDPNNPPEKGEVYAFYCPNCDRSVALCIDIEHLMTMWSESA